jgi:hypothetical protein
MCADGSEEDFSEKPRRFVPAAQREAFFLLPPLLSQRWAAPPSEGPAAAVVSSPGRRVAGVKARVATEDSAEGLACTWPEGGAGRRGAGRAHLIQGLRLEEREENATRCAVASCRHQRWASSEGHRGAGGAHVGWRAALNAGRAAFQDARSPAWRIGLPFALYLPEPAQGTWKNV